MKVNDLKFFKRRVEWNTWRRQKLEGRAENAATIDVEFGWANHQKYYYWVFDHVGAEIDAKTIQKLKTENRRHKRARAELKRNVNSLRVAGSAMSLIINSALEKFDTPRFDMDLFVSETHSSTKICPQISLEAKKTVKSDNNYLLVPKCSTE